MAPRPNDQPWFNRVAAIAIAAVTLGGAMGILLAPPAAPSPASTATVSTPTAFRNLSIQFDPTTGGFVYSSLEILVPLHTRVIFTITNFDPSIAYVPNASDALVQGTVNGSMTVARDGMSVAVGGVSLADVSHTFTVDDASYHLNIPIPPAQSSAVPDRVSFAIDFVVVGTFSWGCVVLCGGAAMTNETGMYGSITVA